MATSSEWVQLWDPISLYEQETRHDSLPVQLTSSSQIVPEPDPNLQRKWYWIKAYFDDLYNTQTYFQCDNDCCLSCLCTMYEITYHCNVLQLRKSWEVDCVQSSLYDSTSNIHMQSSFICVILILQWWCLYFCIYNRLTSDSCIVKTVVVMSTLTFQFLF